MTCIPNPRTIDWNKKLTDNHGRTVQCFTVVDDKIVSGKAIGMTGLSPGSCAVRVRLDTGGTVAVQPEYLWDDEALLAAAFDDLQSRVALYHLSHMSDKDDFIQFMAARLVGDPGLPPYVAMVVRRACNRFDIPL